MNDNKSLNYIVLLYNTFKLFNYNATFKLIV